MINTLSSINELNNLESIDIDQKVFERQAKSILARKDVPGSIGTMLDKGIKSGSAEKACRDFYNAMELIQTDDALNISEEKRESLSHLARVIIIESLTANGYRLDVVDSEYGLYDKAGIQVKNKNLLDTIGITDVNEARKVLLTIEEHKRAITEIIKPRVATVTETSQTKRQLLALQINTGTTKEGAYTPDIGFSWGDIFGDTALSRVSDENTLPVVGLAAAFGLAKFFGMFDWKIGSGGGDHDESHDTSHDTSHKAPIHADAEHPPAEHPPAEHPPAEHHVPEATPTPAPAPTPTPHPAPAPTPTPHPAPAPTPTPHP